MCTTGMCSSVPFHYVAKRTPFQYMSSLLATQILLNTSILFQDSARAVQTARAPSRVHVLSRQRMCYLDTMCAVQTAERMCCPNSICVVQIACLLSKHHCFPTDRCYIPPQRHVCVCSLEIRSFPSASSFCCKHTIYPGAITQWAHVSFIDLCSPYLETYV